jgi:hypothetical protein
MSQAAFAKLCGVSSMMVSKQKASGFVVIKSRKVDAAESLKLLEGHLDEGKRRAAIERLASIDQVTTAPRAHSGDTRGENEGGDGGLTVPAQPHSTSWRVKKDEAEAKLRQLDLAERTGLLVDAIEVRKAIEDAVTAFWSEVDRRRRQSADEISIALELDAKQTLEFRKLLMLHDHQIRKDYAAAMQAAADTVTPQAEAAA